MPRKERQLRIRSVLRDEPDIEKLALAIIRLAESQLLTEANAAPPAAKRPPAPNNRQNDTNML